MTNSCGFADRVARRLVLNIQTQFAILFSVLQWKSQAESADKEDRLLDTLPFTDFGRPHIPQELGVITCVQILADCFQNE